MKKIIISISVILFIALVTNLIYIGGEYKISLIAGNRIFMSMQSDNILFAGFGFIAFKDINDESVKWSGDYLIEVFNDKLPDYNKRNRRLRR
jgi:hypothetical protein